MSKYPGFEYDVSKRMWYKHTSTCHDAPLTLKMLHMGKIVTDEKFNLITSGTQKVTEEKTIYKKLFWKFHIKLVKEVTRTQRYSDTKPVQYRYYCDKCKKQDEGKWEFKHV